MNRKDVKEVEERRRGTKTRRDKEERGGERERETSVSLLKLNAMCREQMGQLDDSSAKDDTTKGATCIRTNTYPET